MISTIPGIGKKSAQRLIIELKDKIGKINLSTYDVIENIKPNNIVSEAQEALITLGYQSKSVVKIINELRRNNSFSTSEELIKLAIKKLYSTSKGK